MYFFIAHDLPTNLLRTMKKLNMLSYLILHGTDEEIVGTVSYPSGKYQEVCDLWDAYLEECEFMPQLDDFEAFTNGMVSQVLVDFYQP